MTTELLIKIENTVLQWPEVSAKEGDFGAWAFLFRRKEFGHIHDYGDLDIFFRKEIETELLQKNLMKRHPFVPNAGVSFRVSSEEDLPFGLDLLRFSYLIHYIKAEKDSPEAQEFFNAELMKLPESLQQIWHSQQQSN